MGMSIDHIGRHILENHFYPLSAAAKDIKGPSHPSDSLSSKIQLRLTLSSHLQYNYLIYLTNSNNALNALNPYHLNEKPTSALTVQKLAR